jgi:hypothetical protein
MAISSQAATLVQSLSSFVQSLAPLTPVNPVGLFDCFKEQHGAFGFKFIFRKATV